MFGFDDAAIALLMAGGLSTAGQLYSNAQNRKVQQEINDQNLQLARENNAVQIEMANTAHQREVDDLKAAGFNPILSTGTAGASTPILRTPEMGTWQTDNPVSNIGSTASAMSRFLSNQYKIDNAQKMATTENLLAQNDNLKAQNDNLKADNDLKHAQAYATLQQADLTKQNAINARYPGLVGQALQTGKSVGEDINKFVNEVSNGTSNSAKSHDSFIKQVDDEVKETVDRIKDGIGRSAVKEHKDDHSNWFIRHLSNFGHNFVMPY